LFLGFQPLNPKSAQAPPPQHADNNALYLIYNIDD
jgi:hypothetical protein